MSDVPETSYSDIPFQAIVEQSLAGIYIIQDECLVYMNETWANMLGYTVTELQGKNMRPFIHDSIRDDIMEQYYKRIRGEVKSVRLITKAISKSGKIIRIEVHGTQVEYRGRPAVAGIGVDVTERMQQEEELRQSKEALQTLTAYVNSVREEQRSKFARELHDVLGGMLTSIKMDVTRILRRVRTTELQNITKGLLSLAQETIDEVRRISEELRPSVLDHIGLSAAFDKELKVFAKRYGVECTFKEEADVLDIPPQSITATYRIFQEAMTNIARHAEASAIVVTLSRTENELVMNISDDGVGIDLKSLRIGSIGLLSMSERARGVGGTLEISPGATGGTQLRLCIPI